MGGVEGRALGREAAALDADEAATVPPRPSTPAAPATARRHNAAVRQAILSARARQRPDAVGWPRWADNDERFRALRWFKQRLLATYHCDDCRRRSRVMRGIEKVIDQLERSLDGVPWHGASLCEILEGVSAREAAAHPVRGGHSIWELVYHVTAWVHAVHSRVQGRATEPEGEADWPSIRDTSENAWTVALEDLRRSQSELIATLKTLSDADLSASVPNRGYDRAHLLHGLTQHHAYHAGQMSLLKQAMQHQAKEAPSL